MTDPTTRADGPHLDGPEPGRPKGRRWPRRLALALTTSLLAIGPWPVDDSGFEGGKFRRRTLERLDGSRETITRGPIRVGLAEVDLTPDSPRPLAGFIGQIGTPYVGIDSRCFARALTVESNQGAVTILTADLLLINAKLAKEVVERAGLRPDQVYFTSSHTHGGPGGWGDHPLEMLVAGAYDSKFFERLAGQLADVVTRSRARTEPAEMAFVEVQARARQRNRVDPASPTHDALSGLVFRPAGSPGDAPPLAILAVFGAHATVSHPVPPRLGGDYPAALASELKRRTGARSVLFASGAVGDASPARPEATSQSKGAEALGKALAVDLTAALPSARFDRELSVGNFRLDVDLPPVRLPFFAPDLRFSPLLTWWIADRRTHLHALRLGPAVLLGFPGDYSGHLAGPLVDSARKVGLSAIPTSFDGDFRGYLVSESVFRRRPCYETRWMSFYGPGTGDYFNDLARRMVGQLQGNPEHPSWIADEEDSESPWPPWLSVDSIARVALTLLLVCVLATGWRGLRVSAKAVRRARWLTIGVASAAVLAFDIDPGLVDWAGFGAPWWLRLAGFPLGVVTLARSGGRFAGKVAVSLGLSCALLSGSWLVVLLTLRGWLRGGLGRGSEGIVAAETDPTLVAGVELAEH